GQPNTRVAREAGRGSEAVKGVLGPRSCPSARRERVDAAVLGAGPGEAEPASSDGPRRRAAREPRRTGLWVGGPARAVLLTGEGGSGRQRGPAQSRERNRREVGGPRVR